MSEQAHFDAIKALLVAAGAVPLTLAEIKTKAQANTLPAGYTELYVTERYTDPTRVDDWSGPRGWRVQLRAVGTTENNVRAMREKARLALEDQTVTVGGSTAPIGRASNPGDPIGEDSGRYSGGLSEYTYVL